MQNTAIEVPDYWASALRLFDDDMRRRGLAEKTRRAYGLDMGQFAAWAARQEIAPEHVDLRVLRRYAAAMAERRLAPATAARKLAAQRAFFRVLREHSHIDASPADLLPSPRRPRNLPDVLKPEQLAALLD